MEKTVNINNFIGIYDNYITKEECNKAIKLFEDQNKFNNTLNRIALKNHLYYKNKINNILLHHIIYTYGGNI